MVITKIVTRWLLGLWVVVCGYTGCGHVTRVPDPLCHPFTISDTATTMGVTGITVSFSRVFATEEVEWMRETFPLIEQGLGVHVREATTSTPNLMVVPWVGRHHAGVIGLYHAFTNTVHLDVFQIKNHAQFQGVFLHEVGHWLGMHHVCVSPSQLPSHDNAVNSCSPVGFGEARMNPEVSSLPTPTPGFTPLDVLEWHRVQRCAGHLP